MYVGYSQCRVSSVLCSRVVRYVMYIVATTYYIIVKRNQLLSAVAGLTWLRNMSERLTDSNLIRQGSSEFRLIERRQMSCQCGSGVSDVTLNIQCICTYAHTQKDD